MRCIHSAGRKQFSYEVILRKKQIFSAAAAIVVVLTGTIAFAQSSGFSDEKGRISASPAPHDNKYTQIQWGGDVKRENWGIPVPNGELVFLPTSDKLLALSEADGSETASVELPQNCSTSFSGAISEKKLLAHRTGRFLY